MLYTCTRIMATEKILYLDYLKILDAQVSKRNSLTKDQLLEILELSQDSWEKSKEFTEKRRVIWFRLVMKEMNNFESEDLVHLWKTLEDGSINPETYTSFFAAWEEALVKKLKAQELIEIVRIYSEKNIALSAQLMKRWSDLAKVEVTGWPIANLSFVVYAFAKLKVRPSDRFLRSWTELVVNKIHLLQPADLANLIYASGKLSITDAQLETCVRDLVRSWEDTKIRQMNAQELIKTAEGVLHLNIYPQNFSNTFVDMFIDKVSATMDRLTSRDLARTAGLILVQMNFDPRSEFVDQWKDATLTKLDTYGARDLHLTLTGAVHFGLKDEKTFLDRWLANAQPELKNFWPAALSSMLVDLHFLGGKPLPESFLKEWARCCSENMGEMYAKDLVTVMVGLAMYEEDPSKLHEEFLDEWYNQMSGKMNRISLNAIEEVEKAFSDLHIQMRYELVHSIQEAKSNWKVKSKDS